MSVTRGGVTCDGKHRADAGVSPREGSKRRALRNYAAKQAALKHFQNPPTADDVSPAKPVMLIEPLARLDLDRAA